jgi:hypothetical protein
MCILGGSYAGKARNHVCHHFNLLFHTDEPPLRSGCAGSITSSIFVASWSFFSSRFYLRRRVCGRLGVRIYVDT